MSPLPDPWLLALLGGLLIGCATAIMLLCLGRIAGISGLTARACGLAAAGPRRGVALAFLLGLPLGAALIATLRGGVIVHFPTSTVPIIIAGLLVGFGTRLGSGCTSGHGICGTARFSRRSLAATATFMICGIATVTIIRLISVGASGTP